MKYRAILVGLTLILTGCEEGLFSSVNIASNDLEEAVSECSGDPWARFRVSAIDAPPADSEAYVVPDGSRRSSIESALDSFQNESYESAVDSAEDAAYELCREDSDVGPLVFWYPTNAGEGHARWVLRVNEDARPLIVESPHSFFEGHTMEQAVETFRTLDARALLVNAGHRCSNQTASGCDGTTSVCGNSDEPFRESDMAHTVRSFFQVAHQKIAAAYTQTWAVNLHGMSRDGFSLSNGTTNDTQADTPVAQLYAELDSRFPDEQVTTCNAFDSVASDEHLCGTTNVQGRVLNGSNQACTTAANTASDRFIHLEQNLSIRESETNRSEVIQALDAIVPN